MKSYVFVYKGKKVTKSEPKNPFLTERNLSVVIPTYNEEENLENIVNAVEKNIKKTKMKDSFEIIIVDDDSKDSTPEIMNKLAKSGKIIAVHRKGIKGIFSAVDDGIHIANGKFILTLDSDFSHPPELIPKMIIQMKEKTIVYGSRYSKGGGMKQKQMYRNYGSVILNWLCRKIARVKSKDFGGQFRVFSKKDYLKIKFRYESFFGDYGLELFYRAERLGISEIDVPFVYISRIEGHSKMGDFFKIFSLGLKYLKLATKLRLEKS